MKINLFESADLETFAPRRVQKLESLVSCGIPVVIAKQAAKPLPAVHLLWVLKIDCNHNHAASLV